MEDQEDKEDGEINYAEMNAESNHGESNEDHNTSKNDQHSNDDLSTNEHSNNEHASNEHPTKPNELNEEDKENASNEPNDHDPHLNSNELDDIKERENNSGSNHLETNSSLFTFDNALPSLSNVPMRRLKPNLIEKFDKSKLQDNSSFISISGFKDRNSEEFRKKFEDTLHQSRDHTTESNFSNKPKYESHDHQTYSKLDQLDQMRENKNSQTISTTASYFVDNSNEWSGSLSSSTVFTPIRALKRKNNSAITTSTVSPNFSTSTIASSNNKRKQNDLMMFGLKKKINKNSILPHRTADETNNQLITTSNSAEHTSINQNVDNLSFEETENKPKNGTSIDKPISELLNERINFNYHPILDFINRKE